jgi:hypothetical protein
MRLLGSLANVGYPLRSDLAGGVAPQNVANATFTKAVQLWYSQLR